MFLPDPQIAVSRIPPNGCETRTLKLRVSACLVCSISYMFILHNKVLDVLLLSSLQLGFCIGGCMKLRAQPLMSYRRVCNWPPVWVGTNHKNEPLRGEVGILEDVVPSQTENEAGFFCVSRTRDGDTLVVCCLRICLFADKFTN